MCSFDGNAAKCARFAGIVTQRLDGRALLDALEAAEARLAAHVDHVNRLNVYPVPDGDTGTNMLHTVRSSVIAARRAEGGAGAVAAAAAHGALMGARGNSGVILSQIVAGAKLAFGDLADVGGAELVDAFAKGEELAYRAVAQPVEGTILTAIRAMAEAVRDRDGASAGEIFDAALEAGRAAVARTPDLLPVLKQAGVVDAGAQGLVYVVEGIADRIAGRVRPIERSDEEEAAVRADATTALADLGELGDSWGYDVQYLVPRPSRGPDELRGEMLAFGLDDPTLGCVLVVGDESLLKVHVHTTQPDEILRIGLSAGRLRDVVVENLDAMAAARERATGQVVTRADVAVRPLACVAVVAGRGLADVCRSLGAVPLPASPKPSVEELLAAVRDAPGESVLVLPNDKDVVAAAEQAARASTKPVRVLPTRTMGQGMTALVAFDAQGSFDAVAEAMSRAASATRSVEVTRAARDATVDGVAVREGEHLALVDGRCVGTAATPEDALAVGGRSVGPAELCTIYVGEGVDGEQRALAAAKLREAVGCDVELVEGGQPHYPYIVSTE